MKKNQILAYLLATFFGSTQKTLSETENPEALTDFQANTEKLAEELEQKENKITELENSLSDASKNANVEKAQIQAKLDKAESDLNAFKAELEVFGKTAEERSAFLAENTRLAGWYEEEKGKKNNPSQSQSQNPVIESKKDAKIAKLEGFPSLKKMVKN
jgi:septal ring factor EnvC (AmiA/AmiB activator)